MKQRNEGTFYLLRCALPNLLGALYLLVRMAFFENLREPSILLSLGIFLAASLFITALAIRANLTKTLSRAELPAALVVCLLSLYAAQRVYTAPMPAQILKQEFVLLLGSGFSFMSAGQLILSRTEKMEPKEMRHAFLFGGLIPFFLTLLLMLSGLSNIVSTLSLCGILSLYCLGALFLLLSALPKTQTVLPEEDEEDKEAGKKRKRRFAPYKSPTWVTLFGILFPVAGLVLNASMGGIISNFSNPWFYIVSIGNGFAMLLSAFRYQRKAATCPVLLFLKSIGILFVAYFVLVFVPYLPLGAILLLGGVGALILTPAILLATEITQLVVDYKNLCQGTQKGLAILAMSVGFATLPLLLTGNALIDRVNYQRALSSISAEPKEAKAVSAGRLSRTISTMNASVSLDSIFTYSFFERGFGQNLPILSLLYGQIVYSNEPLTKSAVEALLVSYFPPGRAGAPDVTTWNIKRSRDFLILSHQVRTTKDASGAYRTWVDFELQYDVIGARNLWMQQSMGEYATEFALPEDCFVTDYYLFVGLEKKQGILSEKSAANQIYEAIVSRQRDPGKLCYTDEGALSLRIFPFAPGEVRKTGFELLHAQPLTFTIDGVEIHIEAEPNGDLSKQALEILSDESDGQLPYVDNAYLNAAILTHNTDGQTESFEPVVESFKHQVLTSRTCFIALESLSQENALKFLQTQIMNGESTEPLLAMDEPWLALLLSLFPVALLLRRRYNSKKSY